MTATNKPCGLTSRVHREHPASKFCSILWVAKGAPSIQILFYTVSCKGSAQHPNFVLYCELHREHPASKFCSILWVAQGAPSIQILFYTVSCTGSAQHPNFVLYCELHRGCPASKFCSILWVAHMLGSTTVHRQRRVFSQKWGHKLRSGLKWQGPLKQSSVKQGLPVL